MDADGSLEAASLPAVAPVAELLRSQAEEQAGPRERLLANLRRRSIPGLDGIRGIAALAVVAFHGWSERFPGRHAVQTFFVISGLLITWLLLQEESRKGKVDRKAFYVRRAFRLLPALYLLLMWEVITRFPLAPRNGLIASAFYYANYYVIFGGQLITLAHMWSLAIEEHFYLIWPQVFSFVRNRAALISGCFLIAMAEFVWRVYACVHINYWYGALATETTSSAVLVGCGLALLLWYSPEKLPRWVLWPYLAPVSLLMILLLAQLSPRAQWIWALPASIPFAAILVLQAATYEWRILENPVAHFLGRISYGIYLWGFVAIAIAQRIGQVHGRTHFILFAAVIGLAATSHYLVERPLQAVGRRLLKASA